MKVEALIKQLQDGYAPDDEIAVAYWDKETVEDYAVMGEGEELTDEEWVALVGRYEDGEWGWQGWAADTFVDLVRGEM
jgi:hypothetical protein